MPGLWLHTSNRTERLAERLGDVIEQQPLERPLAPEVIAVQGRGMARWLQFVLAERFGVWAGGWFPFPNALIRHILDTVLGAPPSGEDRFEAGVLAWTLFDRLPELARRPELGSVQRYLREDRAGLKQFQLAQRVAGVLDRYTMYRGDLLEAWEAGANTGEAWQAELWRDLLSGGDTLPAEHPAARSRALREALSERISLRSPLPQRICVFGVTVLTPLHLDVLSAVSSRVEVHFFLVSPGPVGPMLQGPSQGPGSPPATAAARGLAPGRLLVELSSRLHDVEGLREERAFVDPGRESLLARLQSDLLDPPRDGGEGGGNGAAARPPAEPGDFSVLIHSCHGPMREVEVLHDHVLDWLERLDGLEPRDIVVMTPDIETLAPYVRAVFDNRGGGPGTVPYSIADRSLRGSSGIVEGLLRILEMEGGRLPAPEVLDLLQVPALARRFGLDLEGMELVREWVEAVRIRWGGSAEDRVRLGFPAFAENTWEAGLDRLLLGHALAGEGVRTFGGVLPHDDVEGKQAEVAGRLAELVWTLRTRIDEASSPRSLEQWADWVESLLVAFFLPQSAEQEELEALREAITRLRHEARTSGFTGEVGVRVLRAWLSGRLKEQPLHGGFLTGRITFCSLVPMRSVPFRVVALLGMNDGAFPRNVRPPSFDLMAREPRPGDPARRDEDRLAFLEAVLSARDVLHISYSGQSARGAGDSPPSVVVSELLDTLAETERFPDGADPRERLVVRHRLQGFSPAYFQAAGLPEGDRSGRAGETPAHQGEGHETPAHQGEGRETHAHQGDDGTGGARRGGPGDPRLFSYSREELPAVETHLAGESREPPPFVASALPPPEPEHRGERVLELDRLVRFLHNPCRHFLEQRLAVRLEDLPSAPRDREPFALDVLDGYQLDQRLLAWALDGLDMDRMEPVARGLGILPPLAPGRQVWEHRLNRARVFARRLRPLLEGREDHPDVLDLDTVLDPGPEGARVRLVGRVPGPFGARGLVRYRLTTVKGKDQLRAWVEHLALLARDADTARVTWVVGEDRCYSFGAVDGDPFALLADLVRLHDEGLCRPLPFFPASSLAFVEGCERGGPQKGLEQARRKYESNKYSPSNDEDDRHVQQCFRNRGLEEILGKEFQQLASDVLGPMLRARREEGPGGRS